MVCLSTFSSPLGVLRLAADGQGLRGLWFPGQSYAPRFSEAVDRENEDITVTKQWLEVYFSGKRPDFLPRLCPIGSEFQRQVWDLLLQIPYGESTTYGALVKKLSQARGLERMSAQAVGGAVGHNPISILIPCHRVLGVEGRLTGYAGGRDKKAALLTLEGIPFLP